MCELLDYVESRGMEKGMEKGIAALIDDNIDEGVSMSRISVKLQKLFGLDEASARMYVEKYARQ